MRGDTTKGKANKKKKRAGKRRDKKHRKGHVKLGRKR